MNGKKFWITKICQNLCKIKGFKLGLKLKNYNSLKLYFVFFFYSTIWEGNRHWCFSVIRAFNFSNDNRLLVTEKHSVLFRGPSLEKRNVPIPISMSMVLLFWYKKMTAFFFHTSTKCLTSGCCYCCCSFLLIMKSTWSYTNWWIEKKSHRQTCNLCT